MEKPESDDDDDDDFQRKEIKTEPLDVKPGKGNSKLKQKNSTTSNISEPQPSTSKQPVSQNLSKQVDFKFSFLIFLLNFSPFFVRFVHLCLCYLQGTMKEPPAIQRANESPRKIEKVNKMQVIVPRLVPSPPNGSARAIIKDDDGDPKSPNSSAITWISDEVMSNTKILETSNELDEAGQDEDTVS